MTSVKVLHLITSLNMGGTERMLLKTIRHLSKEISNIVCCFTVPGKMSSELQKQGVEVSYLGYKKLSDLPKVVTNFKRLIQLYQPDILVTYLIHSDIFGRIFGRLFKVKTIICSVRSNLSRSEYFPFFIMDGLTSFLVDKYHFNSRYVSKIYQKWFLFPKDKFTVIPNSIDFEMLASKTPARLTRKSLGLTGSDLVIGSTAKLRPGKGHLVLLEAFSRILPRFPSAKLVFVGDGPLKSLIEMKIKELNLTGKVVMTGDRNDVFDLLKTFDIFAQATTFEGMSNSLLEAMAIKLAVVTTDIPENRELVTDGIHGLLCRPTPGDFADKLIYLLSNPEFGKNLGQNACQKIKWEVGSKHIIKQK